MMIPKRLEVKLRFLVTGGAGFIGSNIVKRLVEKGFIVRVLDNFATGQRANLEPFKNDIELIEGDIRDFWTVVKATKGIDYILHQAALPSIPRSIDNPLTTTEVNINGTLNLLEAARFNNVQRIVYASSSSVYGDSPVMPKEEQMKPMPKSPYAITKLAGEEYCINFHYLYGLETVALRYFNVFGPRQNPFSQYAAVIPKFINMIKSGQNPTINGDGKTSRDFTYVDNIVDANLLACEKKSAVGHVINVACNKAFTLNELVETLNRILGVNIPPVYGPEKKGEVKYSLADITKAQKLLDFTPKIDFEQGLRLTIEWMAK
jgi:nucleoside-diphosphate-sugar epimerase